MTLNFFVIRGCSGVTPGGLVCGTRLTILSTASFLSLAERVRARALVILELPQRPGRLR